MINLYAVYWPTEPAPTGGIPYLDKVAHFGIFALVSLTGRWAGIRLRWLAPLLVVQAVGSEIIQGTLESSGRDGNAFDAMADLLGVAAGLGAWEFVVRRRRRPRRWQARGPSTPACAIDPGHRCSTPCTGSNTPRRGQRRRTGSTSDIGNAASPVSRAWEYLARRRQQRREQSATTID